MLAYSKFHMDNQTGAVKCNTKDFQNIQIFEEENYWKTGYNYKLIKNNTTQQVFIMSHTHLDFKNGLMIKTDNQEDYIVSRSQYVFSVPPGGHRGVYTKPYTGFMRGGQANTPKLVESTQYDQNVLNYYQSHYDRYNLASYNIPLIEEDGDDDNKLPDDRDDVEDEGTAPAVKSGFRAVKSKGPKTKMAMKKTFT